MFSVVELDNTRTLVVCLRLNTTPSSSLNLLEKMKKKNRQINTGRSIAEADKSTRQKIFALKETHNRPTCNR